MFFTGWKNNKFQILGISLAKIKAKGDKLSFYLFGIFPYRKKDRLANVVCRLKDNKDFDVSAFDRELETFVPAKNERKPQTPDKRKVAYIASALYTNGGHTKCLCSLAKSLADVYTEKVFLSRINSSAPSVIREIKQYAEVGGTEYNLWRARFLARKLAAQIADFNPRALMVYIHPNDVIGTMALALIKKTTNIKIVYFNHASHFPALGMSFADVILEGMPSTKKITEEKRHFHNCRIVGLQSRAKDETVYYSPADKKKEREKLGVCPDEYLTMSGGTSYKFFDDDGSAYFAMIKNLLLKEPKLKHIVVTELSPTQKKIVKNIFAEETQAEKRLLFAAPRPDFDLLFQCADVFIDSFPVSSALTQIDLMRNQVASVVKINRERPEFSFHEYQMPDYPYMFDNAEDMEKAVSELLHNENKRRKIIAENYDYWLKTYESNIVKKKYISIIEEND